VLASVVLGAALAGCDLAAPPGTAPAAPDRTGTLAPGPPGSARALLTTLPVKGRAPKTGYDRDRFGPAWADTDRNGCDTRNDVLARDLAGETFRPGTHDCVVQSGRLADPYTGRTITFSKARANAVQIDHVVALADAWQTGAATWPAARRRQFANDPLNLLAVDGPTNQAKGDGDAATWLPPAKPFRCRYVARQVAVKAKYRLWVTPAERAALARVLAGCPREAAPRG
jgi:hypothetical protein